MEVIRWRWRANENLYHGKESGIKVEFPLQCYSNNNNNVDENNIGRNTDENHDKLLLM